MKTVLVLDKMPTTCNECQLCVKGADGCSYCMVNKKIIVDTNRKKRNCKLKALPERKVYPDTCNDLSHADGWNFCLDEITN
jgi:hypothetical protein